MNNETRQKVTGLGAEYLETHFLFGFLFSRLEFGTPKPKSKLEYERDLIEQEIRKVLSRDKYFANILREKSLCFRNDSMGHTQSIIQYYVLLDNPYLNLEFEPIEVEICEKENMKVGKANEGLLWRKALLHRYIRLYESGMGIYRICVIPVYDENRRTIGASEIVSLADSGSPISEITNPEEVGKHRFTFRYRQGSLRLFDLYVRDVSELKRALSTGMSAAFSASLVGSLFDELSWIEFDNNIIVVPAALRENESFENPYVFNKIIVQEGQFNEMFFSLRNSSASSGSLSSVLEQDIQSILLRRVEPGLTSQDYVSKYAESIDGTLANMCVSSRAFVNMHIRSMLYISSDARNARWIDEALLPTLLDTLELIRMRWYAFVVINRRLDILQKRLCEQCYLLTTGKEAYLGTDFLDENQKDLIRVISEISPVLELPLSYRRASGTATTIYDLGNRLFEIKELQEIVATKTGFLVRLFDNIEGMRRRFNFAAIEPKLWESAGLRSKKTPEVK